MMLAAKCHLGSKNCDYQMERYISCRQNSGIYVINLGKTWDKLVMAARIIAAVENPQDVCVLSERQYGQRAVLKFCQYTGCKALAGRHTPGTFTNQIQKMYEEPRLLVLTDPRCAFTRACAWLCKRSTRWGTSALQRGGASEGRGSEAHPSSLVPAVEASLCVSRSSCSCLGSASTEGVFDLGLRLQANGISMHGSPSRYSRRTTGLYSVCCTLVRAQCGHNGPGPTGW